jgi:hypothetical protein
LDQQFYWAFHRYAVGVVWDNKGGLRSSAKVIHAIKFYKAVSIREWHTSSSSEEYDYSGVWFCYDRFLGLVGSYRIGTITVVLSMSEISQLVESIIYILVKISQFNFYSWFVSFLIKPC